MYSTNGSWLFVPGDRSHCSYDRAGVNFFNFFFQLCSLKFSLNIYSASLNSYRIGSGFYLPAGMPQLFCPSYSHCGLSSQLKVDCQKS